MGSVTGVVGAGIGSGGTCGNAMGGVTVSGGTGTCSRGTGSTGGTGPTVHLAMVGYM